MLEKRGFSLGRVLTDVCLGVLVGLIICGGAGFPGGMDWRELTASNIRNNTDDVLSDGFV